MRIYENSNAETVAVNLSTNCIKLRAWIERSYKRLLVVQCMIVSSKCKLLI